MNEIELRFLSGEHLGATAKLTLGSYTIGSTDDCDIYIASNENDNVIQINVKDDGVTLKCIKGSALYAGEPLGETEVEFESSTILNINLNCLAWFKEGESFDKLDPNDLGFKALATNNADESQNSSTAMTNDEDEDDVLKSEDTQESKNPDVEPELNKQADSTPAQLEANQTAQLNDAHQSILDKLRHRMQLLTLLSGICILGFILCLLILGNLWFSYENNTPDAVAQGQSYITSQGLKDVSVTTRNGLLIYSGSVPNNKTYSQFIQNLPKTELSTVIEIKILDDVLVAIERAFALQGMTVKATSTPQPNIVKVYGYVKDAFLAKQILDKVQPYLGNLILEPHFTYESKMQDLLFELNAQENLPIRFNCDAFKVLYSGQMTFAQDQNFAALYQKLTQKVQAPVVLENSYAIADNSIVSISQQGSINKPQDIKPQPTLLPKRKENVIANSYAADTNNDQEIFDASKVKGVTLTPMRFLTLQDGSKYFEGTALKNGYILKQISLDKLLFEKNGRIVEINLI